MELHGAEKSLFRPLDRLHHTVRRFGDHLEAARDFGHGLVMAGVDSHADR
jgi:hypothetical protein